MTFTPTHNWRPWHEAVRLQLQEKMLSLGFAPEDRLMAALLWIDLVDTLDLRPAKEGVHAAAVAYAVSQMRGRGVNQKSIAVAFEVSPPTVSKNYRRFWSALELEAGDDRYDVSPDAFEEDDEAGVDSAVDPPAMAWMVDRQMRAMLEEFGPKGIDALGIGWVLGVFGGHVFGDKHRAQLEKLSSSIFTGMAPLERDIFNHFQEHLLEMFSAIGPSLLKGMMSFGFGSNASGSEPPREEPPGCDTYFSTPDVDSDSRRWPRTPTGASSRRRSASRSTSRSGRWGRSLYQHTTRGRAGDRSRSSKTSTRSRRSRSGGCSLTTTCHPRRTIS